MAAYPTSIASDADLIVAGNRLSTTLLGTITAGATTIVVTSGVFPAYSVVTIENERILLGATAVSGTYTGCTRGYDSSTAASHANGVSVSANYVAAHHNVLRTEIQAVEGALGVGLRFVDKVSNAAGFTFSFAGTTNLTGASPATVVITPSPAGINALSVNKHYLYITDSGGGSEAVLLTSVTVGASSTTVGFTPANSHTANQWTLGSATGGIQEAVNYTHTTTGGGTVKVPQGTTTFLATCFLGTASWSNVVAIEGSGDSCNITSASGIVAFTVETLPYIVLRNFKLTRTGSGGSIDTITLAANTTAKPILDGLTLVGGTRDFISAIDTDYLTIRNCRGSGFGRNGILVTGGDRIIIQNNDFSDGSAGSGTAVGIKTAGTCTQISIVGNTAFNNTIADLYLTGDLTDLNVTGNLFETVLDAASSRTRWVVGDNNGSDNTIGAITAAATVTVQGALAKQFTVTGTTTIDTINGFYGTGHEVVFWCPTGLTFSAAGNIKVALTTTYNNQPVYARYNATDSKWYVV